MSEEKKDETVKEAASPVDAVKQEAPASTPNAQAAPAAAKTEAAPVKKEKPTNCASCKKSIKGKRWYYRNGQYYCTKRCWSTTKTPPKTEEAAPKA